MEFLKPKTSCKTSGFFLNDAMFWRCFWKTSTSMFLTMFFKTQNIEQTMLIAHPYGQARGGWPPPTLTVGLTVKYPFFLTISAKCIEPTALEQLRSYIKTSESLFETLCLFVTLFWVSWEDDPYIWAQGALESSDNASEGCRFPGDSNSLFPGEEKPNWRTWSCRASSKHPGRTTRLQISVSL